MSLSLPADSRALLGDQVAQNGTFLHGLRNAQGVIVAMAYTLIEQCGTNILVRIELGDSCNSLTLPRNDTTADRLADFIEELANTSSPTTLTLLGAEWQGRPIDYVLRDALQQGEGSYPLPDDGQDLDVTLVLNPSAVDPRRVYFFFEMHGRLVSLPVRLPLDRLAAFRLLSQCSQDLMANYRSWAA